MSKLDDDNWNYKHFFNKSIQMPGTPPTFFSIQIFGKSKFVGLFILNTLKLIYSVKCWEPLQPNEYTINYQSPKKNKKNVLIKAVKPFRP